jgi:hypothetical protein
VPENGWKTLREGTRRDGLLLMVDFDATGRTEARFSDLSQNLETDYPVWETSPPPVGSEAARSGAGHVEYWLRRVEEERHPVRALLGFCAGSVYAAALADRIAAVHGGPPQLILLDPEVTVRQTLMWQYSKVVGLLSSVITKEETAQARAAGQSLSDACPQVRELKDQLMRLVREVCEPAFEQAGLTEALRAELLETFDSFMSYLAGAADLDPLPRWRSATALSSATPFSGMKGMRSAGMGADTLSVANELEFDVEHAAMLADKDVATAVFKILNG